MGIRETEGERGGGTHREINSYGEKASGNGGGQCRKSRQGKVRDREREKEGEINKEIQKGAKDGIEGGGAGRRRRKKEEEGKEEINGKFWG